MLGRIEDLILTFEFFSKMFLRPLFPLTNNFATLVLFAIARLYSKSKEIYFFGSLKIKNLIKELPLIIIDILKLESISSPLPITESSQILSFT